MADFRRWIPAFAVLVLLAGLLMAPQPELRANMLFPVVTNQAGVDTGLAIDGEGLWDCNLTMVAIELNGARPVKVALRGPGTATIQASAVAPDFQGYATAACGGAVRGWAVVSYPSEDHPSLTYQALAFHTR